MGAKSITSEWRQWRGLDTEMPRLPEAFAVFVRVVPDFAGILPGAVVDKDAFAVVFW